MGDGVERAGALVEQEVRELRAAIVDVQRDLGRMGDPVAARRWLTKLRKERRAWDDDDPLGKFAPSL